ncbi:hypothetical protein BH23ACT12_BH23ACT12_24000 [soil metagenome]
MRIGYEISFTRHFYKPKPLRNLEEIRFDILALEKETEGLLGEIIGQGWFLNRHNHLWGWALPPPHVGAG